MSDESYIGVDPEYKNHAYDTDAPLPSEDPAVAEREQVAAEYIAEAAVEPPLPEPPFVSAEPAAEPEPEETPAEEPEAPAEVQIEAPAEEPQIEQEATVEPQGDDEAAPEDQTPEGV